MGVASGKSKQYNINKVNMPIGLFKLTLFALYLQGEPDLELKIKDKIDK